MRRLVALIVAVIAVVLAALSADGLLDGAALLHGRLIGDRAASREAWLVSDLMILPALYVQIALHEIGHLLVALLLRMQVLSMRVLGARWWSAPGLDGIPQGLPSHVRVRVNLQDRWLAPKMVAVVLGGPLANLGSAWAGWLFADSLSPDLTAGWDARLTDLAAGSGLRAAAIWGLLLGVGNLLPFTIRRSGASWTSDGAKILLWMFAPSRARERQREAQSVLRIARQGAVPLPGRTAHTPGRPDLTALTAALVEARTTGRTKETDLAARLLTRGCLQSGYAALVLAAPVLAATAWDMTAPTTLGAHIAGVVVADAEIETLLLGDTRPPVCCRADGLVPATPEQRLEDAVRLLEHLVSQAPDGQAGLDALVWARLAQRRDHEARKLAIHLRSLTHARSPQAANADLAGALAEARCGDLPQAQRLYQSVLRTFPDQELPEDLRRARDFVAGELSRIARGTPLSGNGCV